MIDLKNIQPLTSFNILIIGDDCRDVYQFGIVNRLSPEAPVPIFRYEKEESRPGMAANVVRNLKQLGCNVQYLHGNTSVKIRLIDSKSKQHIVRLDYDESSSALSIENLELSCFDAVIISDYNKGSVSYEMIYEIIEKFSGPIFIDTKKTKLKSFKNAFVKINEIEESVIESTNENLIVTLGERGARYKNNLYPAPTVEVVDITGAGDTFLASLAFKFLESKNIDLAIEFAIAASSITVQNLGVYAPTIKEILSVERKQNI